MKSDMIVLKFGGAAVATPAAFDRVASIIAARKEQVSNVAVVVSAMGDMTDALMDLALKVHSQPPEREMDMLVSVGERISISLLAMALEKRGIEAVSFTGSQSGIITSNDHADARILDMRPIRLGPAMEEGKVVIIAGYQGVSLDKEITTLGRGGSDTTAVALGCAFGGKVEFYKDVAGIYDTDPKASPSASLHTSLSYGEAYALMEGHPSPVLHPRSIQLAAKNHIPLRVLSFVDFPQSESRGTVIGDPAVKPTPRPSYE